MHSKLIDAIQNYYLYEASLFCKFLSQKYKLFYTSGAYYESNELKYYKGNWGRWPTLTIALVQLDSSKGRGELTSDDKDKRIFLERKNSTRGKVNRKQLERRNHKTQILNNISRIFKNQNSLPTPGYQLRAISCQQPSASKYTEVHKKSQMTKVPETNISYTTQTFLLLLQLKGKSK